MTAGAIALALPLYIGLQKSILQATPIPVTYPLARSVVKVLEKHIAQYPDVELLLAGRPSLPLDEIDVQILLGTPRTLDPAFADPLIRIVRREMQDDALKVKVHCIKELWQVRDD